MGSKLLRKYYTEINFSCCELQSRQVKMSARHVVGVTLHDFRGAVIRSLAASAWSLEHPFSRHPSQSVPLWNPAVTLGETWVRKPKCFLTVVCLQSQETQLKLSQSQFQTVLKNLQMTPASIQLSVPGICVSLTESQMLKSRDKPSPLLPVWISDLRNTHTG